MWRYGGPSDPDRASLEELSDDEVWSHLDWVLQLKPKYKVDGKPRPLNASVVSKLVCFPLFTLCSFPFAFLIFGFESPILYGLDAYKSRLHLPKGPKGVAR